jgi:hypothetical protein
MAPGKTPRRGDEDERYPNLKAQRDWDRAEHVRKGMEAGLSKKEAERHADAEIRED